MSTPETQVIGRVTALMSGLQGGLSAGFALAAVYGEFPQPEKIISADLRALLLAASDTNAEQRE